MYKKLQLIFLVGIVLGCNKSPKEKIDIEAYKAEINQWHQKRIEDLKGNNGWLNIAGLFWLKEGVNTFGSDDSNDIVFPKDKIAPKAGVFFLNNGIVELTSQPDVEIYSSDSIVKSGKIYNPNNSVQPKLTCGSLEWFIIKRDNLYGVRLRDFEKGDVKEFKGVERYEINPEFRAEATLVTSDRKTIDITNVLGQTTALKSPGTLVFELLDIEYRLDALEEEGKLFVIFGDPTNESETYPSGRYLYVDFPTEGNKTIIDFNQAYNPPCAFTPFATCPLPPAKNVLPIAIHAGEKNYKGYEH
jgi:uncharacterized protein (DUF1684 family)